MTRKVAIVTGGSSGIGRSICTALARRGWDVAFTYVRDIEGAEETRRLLIGSGSKVMAAECDAGVGQEVDAFHDAVTAWSGVPDLLVNNAGVQTWSTLLDLSEEDWDRVIRTNLKGCFLNTQAAAGRMRAAGKGGAIVNIGSGCIKAAFPNLIDYAASKAGIDQLTRSSAMDLGPLGIRVNCVAPGAVMIERTSHEQTDYAADWSKITPLRRVGYPDDVAGAVLFFASPEADFVTGQTLYVDGGVFSQAVWPGMGR